MTVITPATLAAARAYITRHVADETARAVVLEALALDAYYGNDLPGRHLQRGCRGVVRGPDDLLGTVTVPRVAGGKAIGE